MPRGAFTGVYLVIDRAIPLLAEEGNISPLRRHVVANDMNSGSFMIPTICSMSFERTRSTET